MLAEKAVVVGDLEPAITKEAALVRTALIEQGLETPMVENGLSDDEKRQRIDAAMTDVMDALGLDLTDDSLCDTPRRIAKMYVDEIFSVWIIASFLKLPKLKTK